MLDSDNSIENGSSSSVAYVEIDLENKEGYYQVKVNAEKEGTENEILEAIVTEDVNLIGKLEIMFMISGIKEAKDLSEYKNNVCK